MGLSVRWTRDHILITNIRRAVTVFSMSRFCLLKQHGKNMKRHQTLLKFIMSIKMYNFGFKTKALHASHICNNICLLGNSTDPHFTHHVMAKSA